MKRRDFLTTGAAAMMTGAVLQKDAFSADETLAERELIDVRILYTPSEDAKKRLLERCDKILIPLQRQNGFRKTGIFSLNQELHADDAGLNPIYKTAVFTVTCAPNFEKLEAFHNTLHTIADADRRIQTYMADALYSEMEATLMRSFVQCPKLEVPTLSPDRVVQFRRYASPSCNRSRAKQHMFDIRGELDLFRRCNIAPIFFGDMLYGTDMPNISYMVSFENNDARVANWKKFVASDEWNQMKDEPAFKDTATRIRNLFLKPTPGSEI